MIPLFDLHRVLQENTKELKLAFEESLEDARFINGPQVQKLEEQLSEYLGVSRVVGVSSGTDALLAIFMSLGLAPGDEILVTPFTFVASATSIVRAGLKPVFVDLAEDSFHPSLEGYEAAITSKTRGLLAVHLFGEPNNLTKLKEYCKIRDIIMIEDCAQAMGSKWNNKYVGTYGDASAFSFFPAKNLGCFGDGGCVATNNNNLVEKIKMVKSHGSKVKYEHEILGGNFRLDTLQASILSVLLPSLDNWIEKRRQNAERYSDALGGIEELKLPRHTVGHSWNQYTIRTKRRDRLKEWLDSRSIGNAIYYPKALHQQKVFNLDQSLPKAERTCKEVLSLPIYPGLQKKEQGTVISAIKDFFKRQT